MSELKTVTVTFTAQDLGDDAATARERCMNETPIPEFCAFATAVDLQHWMNSHGGRGANVNGEWCWWSFHHTYSEIRNHIFALVRFQPCDIRIYDRATIAELF